MDLKKILVHLAEASEEHEIVDGIIHFAQNYKEDGSEKSKEKLIVTINSFMIKHIMESEGKDSSELIDDMEKFNKANRLFKFENN